MCSYVNEIDGYRPNSRATPGEAYAIRDPDLCISVPRGPARVILAFIEPFYGFGFRGHTKSNNLHNTASIELQQTVCAKVLPAYLLRPRIQGRIMPVARRVKAM